MKKIIAAFIILLGLLQYSRAQSFTHAEAFGAGAYESGTSIIADAAGNVWMLGYFSGTTEIAGESRASAGGMDVFLAKFNPDHGLSWLRTFGGEEDDFGRALVRDTAGNVYVMGMSESSPHFDSLTLSGFGGSDITLAKYDADGNLAWANIYGGAGIDFAEGLILQDGQLFLTGTFEGTARFGSLNAFSDASRAAFVFNVDAAGNALWLKKGICYDRFWDSHILGDGQGNIYFLGQFAGRGYFGSLVFEGDGFRNYVLIKMTADGRTLWAQQIRKAPNLMAAWAPEGGILLAGTAGYDIEIDNQVFAGGERLWAARLDTAGNLLWHQTLVQGNVPEPYKLIVAADNSIYLAGSFQDSLLMGADRLYSAARYQRKLFVSHLDENGNILHSIQSGNYGSHVPSDLYFTSDTTLLMVGRFSQTVTMGDQKLKSKGGNDIYLASLSTRFLPPTPSAAAPPYLRIFPNPSDGFVNIDAGGYTGELQFELYDLAGKRLQSTRIRAGEDWVFLEATQRGIYLYRVIVEGGRSFAGRIMRN